MRLLPSQRKVKLAEAIQAFHETGYLSIYEPCDCGSHIRHNNGGNYHEEIYLKRDEGQVFVKYKTTCKLTPPSEWEPCADWQRVIEENADWL